MNKTAKRRRFLRYGLRSFLIVIVVTGIFLGWYVPRIEKQKAAVRWIEENDGYFAYEYEYGETKPWQPIENPNFLGRILGDDYVSNIVMVGGMDNVDTLEPLRSLPHIERLFLTFQSSTVDLRPLSSLSRLKRLDIPATAIGDISELYGLTQLEQLRIDETHGSMAEQDKQKLRESLPNVPIWFDNFDGSSG